MDQAYSWFVFYHLECQLSIMVFLCSHVLGRPAESCFYCIYHPRRALPKEGVGGVRWRWACIFASPHTAGFLLWLSAQQLSEGKQAGKRCSSGAVPFGREPFAEERASARRASPRRRRSEPRREQALARRLLAAPAVGISGFWVSSNWYQVRASRKFYT